MSEAAERRVFEKWYPKASVGAKFAYWRVRARELTNVLSLEDAQHAQSLLTGVTTSAVKQTWGCGHSIYSVNGDALYAACPICYAARLKEVAVRER